MTELAAELTATADDRLAQAEALVRTYCGWHIAPSRTDATFVQQTRAGVILLPSLYVTAVQEVADDDTMFTSTDYRFTSDGELFRSPGSCWWAANTTVTFTHGYAEAPPEVTAIVQAIAQRAVDNPGGVSSQAAGPFNIAYSQSAQSGTAVALLPAEKDILRAYRIPRA